MDFKQPYNLNEFVKFLSTFLPNDFEKTEENLKLTDLSFNPNKIKNVKLIGNVSSLENLCIYEIYHESENDPRATLSRETFRLMGNYGVKKALAAFISRNSPNYRFSLATIDLKLEDSRVTKEYSNPRRYSFYLGPDAKVHTPTEFLIKPGRVRDYNDIKKRFSIEVVNKDFYTKIAILFTKLAGGKRTIGRKKYEEKGLLKLPSTNDDLICKEFVVRLVGRLVFCWFLKKKCSKAGIPLLSDDIVSLNTVKSTKNYYHNVLEPLFFQILNTPMKQRNDKYRQKPWCQIPFLNGGLFCPQTYDFYELDSMGISKYINTLRIPDIWVMELFEIFETYNFTIDENTPIDVELAIDPEMLGRIFENLLAEINPETGESTRKATGSFYTPRPIVEYMVNQSLYQYLHKKTNLDMNSIVSLLSYEIENVALSQEYKEEVLNALDEIKIIDPACGSGAFPLGILQRMLLILQKIDPNSKEWLKKQLQKIDDPILRQEMECKLKDADVNYIHKLGIIQNSIYGVDIQPIAVEISKLRCFLSLIVDEKVDEEIENRGIKALPNLEFKFVCANSLIGLPQAKTQQTLEAINDIENLKRLREEHLRSYGTKKKNIENTYQKLQSKMFIDSLVWGDTDTQTLKLSQWNPFVNEPCNWFDPDWMFGIKSGFDIVIGNPPWEKVKPQDPEFFSIYDSDYRKKSKENQKILREKLLKNELIKQSYQKYLNQRYDIMTYAKNYYKLQGSSDMNYYKLFLERSLDFSRLLVCWIVPGSITIDEGSLPYRKYITDEHLLDEVLGFTNRYGLFEWIDRNQKFITILLNRKKISKSIKIYGWLTRTEGLDNINKLNLNDNYYKQIDSANVTFYIDTHKKTFELLEKLVQNKTIEALRDMEYHYWQEYHATNDAKYFDDKKGSIMLFSGKAIDQFDCIAKTWLEKHGRSSKWQQIGFPKKVDKYRTEYYVDEIPDRIAEHHRKEKSNFRIVIQNVTGTVHNIRTVYACVLHKKHLTNNSLHNLYIGKGDNQLFYYLGILNSFLLDWQARIKVATNLNKFILESFMFPVYESADPGLRQEIETVSYWLSNISSDYDELQNQFHTTQYKNREEASVFLNAVCAKLYKMTYPEFEFIMGYFDLVDDKLKSKVLSKFREICM